MAYWLMKTEPEDYTWERLVVDGRTAWDGVRNHQAANNMRAMALHDPVLFYRSVKDPAVLGIMRVVRTAYPVPDEPTSKFVQVDVAPEHALERPVPLKAIKAHEALADLALVRQSRLSVMPVSEAHWQVILAMSSNGASSALTG